MIRLLKRSSITPRRAWIVWNWHLLTKDMPQKKMSLPLLIELARQGYLSITCENKKGTDFSITLMRSSYEGTKENERLFFDGLKKVATGPVIHKSDLKDRFYKTPEAILKTIKNIHRKIRPKLFHSNSLNKGWILWVLAVVVFAFAYFLPGYQYSYDWSWK